MCLWKTHKMLFFIVKSPNIIVYNILEIISLEIYNVLNIKFIIEDTNYFITYPLLLFWRLIYLFIYLKKKADQVISKMLSFINWIIQIRIIFNNFPIFLRKHICIIKKHSYMTFYTMVFLFVNFDIKINRKIVRLFIFYMDKIIIS